MTDPTITYPNRKQVEEVWVKEAERRVSAWRRGKRAGIPVDQAFEQI